MSSKIVNDRNISSSLNDTTPSSPFSDNIHKNITSKEREYFNDEFYHEQLSKLKLLKNDDNVVDTYESEPIIDGNDDPFKESSVGSTEELKIISDFIYIDDNGKVRINKEKFEINQDNNNIDLILKFMCIYLSNYVPDKTDYERSLINLVLSSDSAKQVEKNIKDGINWKKVQELLHTDTKNDPINPINDDTELKTNSKSNSMSKSNSESNSKPNSNHVKESIEEDLNLLSSPTISVLWDDFKNKIQFPVIYAAGLVEKNYYCVGLVYPEYNQKDEYFKIPHQNPDTAHCCLFTLNEALKRALIYNWNSVQISCNSRSTLKIVYDLVTLNRNVFKKIYPNYTSRFNEFLEELHDNTLKVNINWAIYNNDCPFAKKLHTKLLEYRT